MYYTIDDYDNGNQYTWQTNKPILVNVDNLDDEQQRRYFRCETSFGKNKQYCLTSERSLDDKFNAVYTFKVTRDDQVIYVGHDFYTIREIVDHDGSYTDFILNQEEFDRTLSRYQAGYLVFDPHHVLDDSSVIAELQQNLWDLSDIKFRLKRKEWYLRIRHNRLIDLGQMIFNPNGEF